MHQPFQSADTLSFIPAVVLDDERPAVLSDPNTSQRSPHQVKKFELCLVWATTVPETPFYGRNRRSASCCTHCSSPIFSSSYAPYSPAIIAVVHSVTRRNKHHFSSNHQHLIRLPLCREATLGVGCEVLMNTIGRRIMSPRYELNALLSIYYQCLVKRAPVEREWLSDVPCLRQV